MSRKNPTKNEFYSVPGIMYTIPRHSINRNIIAYARIEYLKIHSVYPDLSCAQEFINFIESNFDRFSRQNFNSKRQKKSFTFADKILSDVEREFKNHPSTVFFKSDVEDIITTIKSRYEKTTDQRNKLPA